MDGDPKIGYVAASAAERVPLKEGETRSSVKQAFAEYMTERLTADGASYAQATQEVADLAAELVGKGPEEAERIIAEARSAQKRVIARDEETTDLADQLSSNRSPISGAGTQDPYGRYNDNRS